MCFQRPRRSEIPQTSVLDIQLVDTSRDLPSDFAIRVIEREIKLEKYWEKSTISELVELYSLAIEYYSLKGDAKAKDYQSRMQKMLRKPEVLAILSPQQPERPKNKISPIKKIETIENAETSEKIENSSSESLEKSESPVETIVQIEETVKITEISDKETGDKLVDSVRSQENDLETRLKRRRVSKAHSNTSFNHSPISEIDSPKSITIEIHDEELENAIQKIMEKNFEEKSEKIAEVTMKYTTEINEMEDSGMMGMVVAQMKNNLKLEIEQLNQIFDEKRRNEVKQFKEEYNMNKNKILSSIEMTEELN